MRNGGMRHTTYKVPQNKKKNGYLPYRKYSFFFFIYSAALFYLCAAPSLRTTHYSLRIVFLLRIVFYMIWKRKNFR